MTYLKLVLPRKQLNIGCLQDDKAIGLVVALRDGGEGEIRTPGTRKGTLAFEASAIDHSATSPRG